MPSAADDTEESRLATRRYHDEFVEATGWTPDRAVTFAGALQYREYGRGRRVRSGRRGRSRRAAAVSRA